MPAGEYNRALVNAADDLIAAAEKCDKEWTLRTEAEAYAHGLTQRITALESALAKERTKAGGCRLASSLWRDAALRRVRPDRDEASDVQLAADSAKESLAKERERRSGGRVGRPSEVARVASKGATQHVLCKWCDDLDAYNAALAADEEKS